MMKCPRCGNEMCWGNDFSYEDMGIDDQEGIVSNYSCGVCEVFMEVYYPEIEIEDKEMLN